MDPAGGGRIPAWQAWVLGARPATLPAAIAPVLVGTAAAFTRAELRWPVFAATLAAALLIQVGTNLANDLFDYQKGADTEARTGPLRVTQAGLLTPRQVAQGTAITFGLAVLLGVYLATVGGWPIVVIGLLSVASGILYTGGPWPIGYHGLGDLFTFIFFGVVAVSGTYYLQTGTVDALALALSIPVALLVTAILVVNNLRDLETDRRSGKRTLAVRIGDRATRLQYVGFVGAAYLIPPLVWLAGWAEAWLWLSWLSLPLALRLARTVWAGTRGRDLNAVLKGTGRLHLLFGLLLSVGLVLSAGAWR